ncbi:hypothetical protein HanRHA438_Chr05g0233341 [Helianthus annuus]|nr:hypothetical protein HanHA89_Chr05g0198351 [Helianthus annuus]KAJ0919756.1 hypothetical protein HanRHA438_Chr05g0233341 [Helianthus annuus]
MLEGPDDNNGNSEEEKNTTNVMENFVLGFNERDEVRIPGDEFEMVVLVVEGGGGKDRRR